MQVTMGAIFIWGLVAIVALTTIMFAAQALGHSRMSFPLMLGTFFTEDRDRANIYGILMHFLLGWLFTLNYALLFESIRLATWWFGTVVALLQGLFMILVVMPLLPYVHPRMASEHDGPMPTRMLEPPGFMGLHYGRRTPIVSLVAHAAFGAIIGGFYQLSSVSF